MPEHLCSLMLFLYLFGGIIYFVLTVVETPIFIKSCEGILSQQEREEIIDWLSHQPEVGDVIPGTNGLRKVRWARAGMGKRGGSRVIYLIQYQREQVQLLIAYSKSKFDNLPPDFLRKLKEQYDA